MPTAGMLGTSWTISVALDHIERVELRDHARSLYKAILGDHHPLQQAPELPPASARAVRRSARDGLLMALRDGYIRATGRLSTTAALFPDSATSNGWRLHSSDASLITTTEWRMGEFDFSRWALTGPSWQYIQIEVPDFMVKAIWPDCVPEPVQTTKDAANVPYTTPYLELMQTAISRFGLSASNQCKKENLSDWFAEQRIDGERISRNIADSMATLIRLPSAQRGGARRVPTPDLRRPG